MTRHALTIAALLAVSSAVQAWCLAHAVMPAQDAVRFTRVAEAIARDGLAGVWRDQPEHPLFPLGVSLAHRVVALYRANAADAWAASAQLVAAVMLVLAVAPVYGLLSCLARWPAAAVGAAFFCVMSPIARLGADGLSDSTHLCLLCAALWAAVRWFGGRRGGWLFAAGLFVALAALVRKEALIVAPAVVAAVVAVQCTPSRRPWRDLLGGGGALVAGLALVIVPYLVATPRAIAVCLLGPSNAQVFDGAGGRPDNTAVQAATKKRSTKWRTSDGQPMVFAKKDARASIRFQGHAAAAKAFVRVLPEAFNYWIGGLAAAGAWLARRRLPPRPVLIFLIALAAIYSLAAIHWAARLGYLAPRHLLPLVVIGLGWAGEGTIGIRNAERGMRNCVSIHALQFRISRSAFRISPPFRISHSAFRISLILLAALACLPRTLAPVHASRLGHRQAAEWLAAQPGTQEAVLDTRGFTRLLSGRKTYALEQAKQALRDPRLAYVVVERRELAYDSPRGRTLRELLASHARPVACFAADKPGVATVEVYEWGTPVADRRAAEHPTSNVQRPAPNDMVAWSHLGLR